MSAIMRRLRRNAMTYQLEQAGVQWWGTSYRAVRRAWVRKFGNALQWFEQNVERGGLKFVATGREKFRSHPAAVTYMDADRTIPSPRDHGKISRGWFDGLRKIFGLPE